MTDALAPEPAWVGDVLDFWFIELSREDWYGKAKALDDTVRARFSGLHETLCKAPPNAGEATARTLLAAVVVLDQFPRNMFRGTARAFASDGTALGLARAAITRGLDRELTFDQRHCLYLPFQHSENPADQARACELYESLGDAEGLDFALRHKAIIDRFGRFPHRNRALGRRSRPEEIDFLEQPGSDF